MCKAKRGMKRNPIVYSLTRKVARLVIPFFTRLRQRSKGSFPIEARSSSFRNISTGRIFPWSVLFSMRPSISWPKKSSSEYHWSAIISPWEEGFRWIVRNRFAHWTLLKKLIALLKSDERIVIFPEGTYFRDIVGTGKNRLLRMILKYQEELERKIPFIPVGIRYRDRRGWKKRVKICIGSPLFAEGESEAASLTERIMEEISRLSCLPRCSK